MPKIKEIQTGANSLNFYTQNLADFLQQMSSASLCAQIDYEPQTTQNVPTVRSINLATIKLNSEILANQKATITAFAKKNNVGQILINEKENIFLVGEFGEKEIEFAKIYETLKASFAPKDEPQANENSKPQPTEKETKAKKEKNQPEAA